MKIILQWLILSAAVYGLAYFIPNIGISVWWIALLVGAALTVIDVIVKPIIKILTLPINLITLGLFSIALNVFFFWFPSKIISGFDVLTFQSAIIGAVIIWLVNWLFDLLKGK
ncbi:hypothetical protein A2645_00635 [Candidatus Nomurabacteria bacterium RIFCSPHIGHO2_01_FULL_39_9]|uniref:Phage holin family protein n=1 Tax=Candidatus Nomurabacteria bacterium RIFCSPHIGHO2_01_FULL_39_9 TaxID=1801735 RepID=A0A1F6UV53_9BACT|nr:MAG: hypothetical protein A2645_00635 [Candidatus Nomurabacteria bacterium RIFCSPHIGHO2_01_FULL_39_9]